jgi:acetyl esterase/lipase
MLLDRAARSPLPPYYTVPPFVARRTEGPVAMRAYRPAGMDREEPLPALVYFHGGGKDWEDWRASPLLAKSLARLPPAFVITAGYDPLLDEGRAYAERLAREGTEVAYRQYGDMVHGFLLFGGALDTANAAVNECSAALRRAFGKVPA